MEKGYDAFLRALKAQGMSGRTVSAYLADVNQFCHHFGFTFQRASEKELGSLRSSDIHSYFASLAARGMCFNTLKRSLAGVRRMYDSLISAGLLHENPARNVSLRAVAGPHMAPESILGAFAFLKDRNPVGTRAVAIRDQLIFLFMLFLGVRQYTIPKILLSNLKKDGLCLTLSKSNSWSLPIEGTVLRSLHAYLSVRDSSSGALFLDARGRTRIALTAVRDLLKSTGEAVSISLTPKLIHQTYLWLQNNTEESSALLKAIDGLLA